MSRFKHLKDDDFGRDQPLAVGKQWSDAELLDAIQEQLVRRDVLPEILAKRPSLSIVKKHLPIPCPRAGVSEFD